MASAVDSRLAYARLSAVATASRLPTANRGSNNSYTTSWDTTVRGGYRITGNTHLGGVTFRPYAGVAHERELNDSPVWVTAGSNTMPGRFTASGFVPPGQWLSADVGVSASLGERTVAVVGYSGRYGHRSRGGHQLNLGLQIAF